MMTYDAQQVLRYQHLYLYLYLAYAHDVLTLFMDAPGTC